MGRPPDPLFSDRRLAATYDVFEANRDDLDAYEQIVDEFAARHVLDVGCGTGEFACRLARRGLAVTAVDPAQASVEIARSKPGAERVAWVVGDSTTLPALQVDLATMTANVAQVFVDDEEWMATLDGIHRALRTGGHLAFETRDPARSAWTEWTPDLTRQRAALPDGEVVETWCELISVDGELVTFRWTNHFESDGATVVSDSTLRFRSRNEIEHSLDNAGYDLVDVRDAPDRPGREMVFIARTR
jgi:SAM-dependent methyltransferase